MGEHLTINLVTVAVEVVGAIALFVILYRVLRRVIRAVAARPGLARFEAVATRVQANLKSLFKLVGGLVTLGILGANGWLMYRGELLHAYTLDLLRSVPRETWINLAIGAGAVLALVIAVAFVLRRVSPLVETVRGRAKNYRDLSENDDAIDELFDGLLTAIVRLAWLGVLVGAAHLLELPASAVGLFTVILEAYAIVAGALLIWRATDVVIISLDVLSKRHVDDGGLWRHYERFQSLVPLLRRCVEYGIYVAAATLVTRLVEFDSVAAFGPRLIRVIGVVFIARAAIELVSLLLEEVVVNRPKLSPPQKQRRITILPLFKSVARYGVYFAAAVYVLGEFGVNLTPILAGAGIAAMAIGLGAQNIINDLVSGFFILFENYFLVGDYVVAGGAQGVVDQIDLRTTRIRDDAGRLHIVRNGNIDSIINYSKDYTHAMVGVGVAYEADLKVVFATLAEIGAALAEEREEVLEPTRVAGVDQFGDSSVDIMTVTKVRPGQHRLIERALRERIKAVFDARGIEIPYPRRYLIHEKAE